MKRKTKIIFRGAMMLMLSLLLGRGTGLGFTEAEPAQTSQPSAAGTGIDACAEKQIIGSFSNEEEAASLYRTIEKAEATLREEDIKKAEIKSD